MVCVAAAAIFLLNNTTQAQVKIGYFDETKVLPVMPGIKSVDTLLALFERDTLNYQYDTTYRNYKATDSTYRKDSASLSADARKKLEDQLTNYKARVLYWNKYVEQRLQYKELQLMYPYKKRLSDALQEVVNENGYTMVVNTNQLSVFATPPLLDNLTIRVALKLGIPLAKGVQEDWNKALAKEAAKAKAGATKPAVKPKK